MILKSKSKTGGSERTDMAKKTFEQHIRDTFAAGAVSLFIRHDGKRRWCAQITDRAGKRFRAVGDSSEAVSVAVLDLAIDYAEDEQPNDRFLQVDLSVGGTPMLLDFSEYRNMHNPRPPATEKKVVDTSLFDDIL